jgi:hypothetical protein
MLDTHDQRGLLDLAQPGAVKQLVERALPGTRKLRLIPDLGIEFARRIPEQAEWALARKLIERKLALVAETAVELVRPVALYPRRMPSDARASVERCR